MKIKVLLIDPQQVVRAGLRCVLELHDIDVVGEADGLADALSIPHSASCQVAIMDVNLADVDVISSVRQLRDARPDLQLLVLTNHSSDACVINALRYGVNGYVLKSASADEVIAAVQRVAEGSAYLDPRVADVIFAEMRERPDQSPVLSRQEREIITLVARGLRNREIAHLLHVSIGTVKGSLASLFARFSVKARSGLVAEAIQRGLLPPHTSQSDG